SKAFAAALFLVLAPALFPAMAEARTAHVHPSAPLVLITDFGVKDGAVSEVKGVAYGVSRDLLISDLTHEIPAGNIWEGAYRLYQTAPYWPKGTVFVGVVDPGVGTSRLSIAVETKAGHYYVLPDNGLVTLIAEAEGIEEVRTIDERTNRLKGSEESNTFYGRDVFGYTGARLAAGVISFSQVGPILSADRLVRLTHQNAVRDGDTLKGMIPVLDVQYGNVWSNIPKSLFDELHLKPGDLVHVRFLHDGKVANEVTAPYATTFGSVPEGKPLVYINSLLAVSVALNLGNYAQDNGIGSGTDWTIEVAPAK
ncbi:MAG: S-adenosyl-l-methionine hydroxide adenosyltransferase family protein, partial [Asticcacaulis sp.]|nr:S-adenosyl-l-methionine hydroxide adenosyltransferase family protein [Asticcacaulis sp.]